MPVRQSKEALRSEIEALKSHQDRSDHVFAAVVGADLWQDVLARLRNGQSVESISERLSGALSSGEGAGASALSGAVNRDISSTSSSFGNAPIASYVSGSGSYGHIGGSMIAISPVSGYHRRTVSHDDDPGVLLTGHSPPLAVKSCLPRATRIRML